MKKEKKTKENYSCSDFWIGKIIFSPPTDFNNPSQTKTVSGFQML